MIVVVCGDGSGDEYSDDSVSECGGEYGYESDGECSGDEYGEEGGGERGGVVVSMVMRVVVSVVMSLQHHRHKMTDEFSWWINNRRKGMAENRYKGVVVLIFALLLHPPPASLSLLHYPASSALDWEVLIPAITRIVDRVNVTSDLDSSRMAATLICPAWSPFRGQATALNVRGVAGGVVVSLFRQLIAEMLVTKQQAASWLSTVARKKENVQRRLLDRLASKKRRPLLRRRKQE
ncbi:hypothetical protein O3P69_019079 [Scylla paramamosain]|uniref:Uncharacterized protein n=1 Tax=Scylla paramamosain TaxID=85552 RepID=A0AAW0T841_SCYPA